MSSGPSGLPGPRCVHDLRPEGQSQPPLITVCLFGAKSRLKAAATLPPSRTASLVLSYESASRFAAPAAVRRL